MFSYYTETHIDLKRITRVVAQNEEGIWHFLHERRHDGILMRPRSKLYRIKLPEWERSREVNGADPSLLEFIRTWERGSQTLTEPSEIREAKGGLEETIWSIFYNQS